MLLQCLCRLSESVEVFARMTPELRVDAGPALAPSPAQMRLIATAVSRLCEGGDSKELSGRKARLLVV